MRAAARAREQMTEGCKQMSEQRMAKYFKRRFRTISAHCDSQWIDKHTQVFRFSDIFFISSDDERQATAGVFLANSAIIFERRCDLHAIDL